MIKTNIKVTNFTLTPDVQDYLNKRLEKIGEILEHHQDEVILRVEIGRSTEHHREGNIFRTELQTHVKGRDLRAVSAKEDIFSAIDEAKDNLIREILHNKEKQETLAKKGGRAIKEMLKKFYK